MINEYAIYDMEDYEQLVYSGTMQQVANYLECSPGAIRSWISHRKRGKRDGYIHKRYEIVKVEEEDIEEKPIKTNAEIFQDLINTFRPTKVEFEVFDDFKWQLKGIKDKVIIDEEWTQIEKTHYSLSNYGRVRNDKNGKIKSPRYHRWIVQVDIYENGKRYTIDIKRLVAHYYIRPLKKTEKVRTIDGDIRNNYYKNLEIVSRGKDK